MPIERVGVVGMGLMGAPMALNLLKAKFPVTVYNRDRSKSQRLADAGAAIAPSVAELASTCDAILTMLSDDAAVRAVMLDGSDSILARVKSKALVIDSSTVHPNLSREIGAAMRAKGAAFLDAPVSGSRPQAEGAKLFFFVGGAAEDYARAIPLFEAMGRRHLHVGPTGAGACVKVCNNLCAFINLAGFCEALRIGEAFGADPAKLVDVILDSGGRSTIADVKAPKILKRDWNPDFRFALAHKDIELARSLATDLNQNPPVTTVTADIYEKAKRAGNGELDLAALYRWYAEEK